MWKSLFISVKQQPNLNPTGMESLPQELWLEIVDLLRSPHPDPTFPHYYPLPIKNIKSLVLVSRYFNQVVEPALYESITVNNRNELKKTPSLDAMQRLYAKPVRMTWVKYLFMDLWTEKPDQSMCKLLPYLTELKSLRVIFSHAPAELFHAVCSLQHLRYLYIDRLTLDESLNDPDKVDVSSIQGLPSLRSLSLYNRHKADSPFHAFAIRPNVKELRISIPNAQLLCSITKQVESGEPSRFENLRVLESYEPLQPDQLEQLYCFMNLCPNLRSFSLNPATGVQSPTFELQVSFPPTAAPLLESFSGSLKVAQAIVPGRPVQEIHIILTPKDWRHITDDHLQTLASGSVPVRHLHLETYLWLKDWLRSVSNIFPEVEEFDLRFWMEHFGSVSKYPMDELENFRKLRRLRIRNGAGDAFTGNTQSIPRAEPTEVQLKFLQDLDASGSHPLLEEVEISGRNEWVKREGKWIHREY